MHRNRRIGSDDEGSTLVLVMLITFMVMLVAATSVSITASNVTSSRVTADIQAAFAAAQAGVDEFGLALTVCDVDYLVADCPTIYNQAARPLVGTDGVARATYAWKLTETPDDDRGLFRVSSTGVVKGTERTLVADYRPTPSFLDFLYFTEVESISPELNRRYYGPRTIQIPTAAFRTAADKRPTPTFVTWSGVQGEEICSKTWYDPPFSLGRSSLKTLQGYEFRETTNTPVVTRDASCDVVFVNGQTFSGRVYSKDAFYFSGIGPMFVKPIRTEWSTSKIPTPVSSRFYRGYSTGQPAAGSQVPKVAAGKMSMPEGLETIETDATCVFTGATRILLVGATAVVTSPGTTLGMLKAGCTPSGGGSTLQAAGLVQVPFPITNTTSFYVQDGVAGGAASQANPLFDLRPPAVIGGLVGGQPALFYSEMNSVGLPVNDTTTKAAVAGPVSTSVDAAMQTWLAQVNATKPAGIAGTPNYQAIAATATLPTSVDPVLERGAQAGTIQRRTCTLTAAKVCAASPAPTAWTNAFSVTRTSHTLPMLGDVTPYTTGLGNAFVEGHLTGKLTIAGENTVVVTDDITYDGTALLPTGTLGLVGDRFVEIYHPVKCATVYTALPTTANHCPDDITGLDSSSFSEATHPSRRYLNLRGTELDNIEIDAAILARDGSFTLQNYMRGLWMGTNTVTGGVYQQYRGPTGIGWGGTSRSGYTTSMSYDPRLDLNPPPNFVEPGEALTNSAWLLLGISGESGAG